MVEAPALHAKAGFDAIPAVGQAAPDVNLQAAPKASPFEPSPGSGAGTGDKSTKLIAGLPEDVFNELPDDVKVRLLALDKVAGILHATIGGTFQKAQEAHDLVTDADLLYLADLDAALGAFAPVTDGPIESGDFPDLGTGASCACQTHSTDPRPDKADGPLKWLVSDDLSRSDAVLRQAQGLV